MADDVNRKTTTPELEELRTAQAAKKRPAADPTHILDKAIYQCDRLAIAIRSSHTEGTRFAAFTVVKIVRDLEADLPPEVVARMKAIKGALEALGLDLSK